MKLLRMINMTLKNAHICDTLGMISEYPYNNEYYIITIEMLIYS